MSKTSSPSSAQTPASCAHHFFETLDHKVEGVGHSYRIRVPFEEMRKRMEVLYNEQAKRVSLPGFRKGKIPPKLLAQSLKPKVEAQVQHKMLEEIPHHLLSHGNGRPVGSPHLGNVRLNEDGSLEFSVSMEFLPDVPAPNLEGLSFTKPAFDREKMIEDVIASMKEREVSSHPIEGRTFEAKDVVLGHLQAEAQEEAPDPTIAHLTLEKGAKMDVEDFAIVLGAGMVDPRLEAHLFGKSALDPFILEGEIEWPVSRVKVKGTLSFTPREAVSFRKWEQKAGNLDPKEEESFAKLRDFVFHNRASEKVEEMEVSILRHQMMDFLSQFANFPVPNALLVSEIQEVLEGIRPFVLQAVRARVAPKDPAPKKLLPFSDSDTRFKTKAMDMWAELFKDIPQDVLQAEIKALAARRVQLGILMAAVGVQNKVEIPKEAVIDTIRQESMKYPGEEAKVFQHYANDPNARAMLLAPLFEKETLLFLASQGKAKEKKFTLEELEEAAKEADEIEVKRLLEKAQERLMVKKEEKTEAKKAKKKSS